MGFLAVLPDGGYLLQVGLDVFHHPRPDIVADATGGDVDHPDGGLHEVQLGDYAEFVGELGAADDGVQERGMHRVHGVFHNLEPVAGVVVALAGDEAVAFAFPTVADGEGGDVFGRPHISENGAAEFVGGIGAVAEAVFKGGAGGFARGFEDGAVDVEQPAVVAATDAALRDQPELQGCAAVGAVGFDHADAAAEIAEGHQFLAEDFEGHGGIAQLVGVADGLPEAAQVFAAGGAGAYVGEFLVFFGDLGVVIAAELGGKEGGASAGGSHDNLLLSVWLLRGRLRRRIVAGIIFIDIGMVNTGRGMGGMSVRCGMMAGPTTIAP